MGSLMRFKSVFCSRFFRPLTCLVALLSIAGSSNAQGVGSSRGLASTTGGIHTIQGKVYDQNGRPMDKGLRIRLESPNTGSLYASTDRDGVFAFTSIENGNYTLTVEGGPSYENAIEHPSIAREDSPNGRILRLDIFMKPKLALDPAFASVPGNALEFYKKGMEAAQKGDGKKAVENLNKAIGVYPQFGPALTELGAQYLKLGDLAKATEVLEAAMKLTPTDFHTRLNYGIALLQQKRFPQAEEQLSVVVKTNPAAPTPHMYLGIALMSQQKLEDAEKELLLSVASNSTEAAPAHKYLGGIYWGQRNYKRAIEELETYLKLAPKAADAERTREGIKQLKAKL